MPRFQRATAEHGPILNEVDAKQGRKGTRVFAVLVASLALVVIAFAILYLATAHPFTPQNPLAKPTPAPAPVNTP